MITLKAHRTNVARAMMRKIQRMNRSKKRTAPTIGTIILSPYCIPMKTSTLLTFSLANADCVAKAVIRVTKEALILWSDFV
ncbi:hypothetical protein [Bartonella doshiae]|uniref:hypothetical protein n=1 Tax=Bartonella doshiae TaxID=33044 RepID=UPI0003040153|nr:hypothetical protein [Bartonella doshiae]